MVFLKINEKIKPVIKPAVWSSQEICSSIGIGDGYFLAGCTSNSTLWNPATINIICGDVQVASQTQFCGSKTIGCNTGGTWDSATSTLTMTHTDNFFDGGPCMDFNLRKTII